ncbi:alpha/beta-hydrolase [Rhizoclosmatium globosum]|uniref:Alpha/beta-hydrolase n=1 Tax=Rhizoclosmatium globosum TaxID=329046 RepID=A0A1Y2D0L3_9FUNG|nr:alpha/beta-hydrolase [Rhizoclosmatium globosum]|eukprot:ORY52666.1 alpha/beta-hydrolase [Rhizoclosmatium globosum]
MTAVKQLGSLASITSHPLVQRHYPLKPTSHFASLSLGRTHYWINGPSNPTSATKRLVLLHGISGTWASMPHVEQALVDAGFQTLAFDIQGRGYSDAPTGSAAKYDKDMYSLQLHELMQHVGWDSASLLGYSLGGGIATAFAEKHTDKVEDLVLIAPAGLRQNLPAAASILQNPILSPIFLNTIGRRILHRISNNNHSPAFASMPHMQHFTAVQSLNILLNPGFIHAYAQTVLNGPIRRMDSTYKAVSDALGDRICCVWGTNDRVVSYKHDSPRFRELCPQATFVSVPGGHSKVVEEVEVVIPPIIKFLKRTE